MTEQTTAVQKKFTAIDTLWLGTIADRSYRVKQEHYRKEFTSHCSIPYPIDAN